MITSRLESKYQEMSAGQRNVADYIKEHLNEAVYMNAKELAEKTSFSESGVVRLAAFLGYKGFKDMQKAIQEEVRIKFSIADRFEEAIEETNESLNDSRKVYNQTLKNLSDTYGYLPEAKLDEAVDEILKARRIGIVGTRVAVAPALTFQILLNQLIPDVRLFIPGIDTSFDMIRNWEEGDLLIGFSFMRKKNFAYDMLSFGKENGCRIISICDNYRNSIASLGDVVLPVRSEAAFLSFAPTMFVLDILLYKLSKHFGSSSSEKLKELDEIIQRFLIHS